MLQFQLIDIKIILGWKENADKYGFYGVSNFRYYGTLEFTVFGSTACLVEYGVSFLCGCIVHVL